jgi:hypothetical protein
MERRCLQQHPVMRIPQLKMMHLETTWVTLTGQGARMLCAGNQEAERRPTGWASSTACGTCGSSRVVQNGTGMWVDHGVDVGPPLSEESCPQGTPRRGWRDLQKYG